MRERMIAPDALLKLDASNAGGDRAALTTIKPAVRSQCERIGDGVRVFHTEAGEQDFGVTVRNIVVIAVGIEKQVRRLEHEHAAMAERESAGEIQASDEVLCPVRTAITVGVLQDCDAV